MPESVTYGKRLVKGSTIVFTAFVASGIVGLLLRMFMARSLSVAEYGLFYGVLALITFFELFRGLGFDTALVKHIPEFIDQKQFGRIKSSIDFTILIRTSLASLIVVIFFVFSSQIASTFFRTVAAIPLIWIIGVCFILMSFSTLTNTFQGFQNMPVYSSIKFFDNLFVFMFALLLVGILGMGLVGVAFAYLLTAFAISILGFTLLRSKYAQVFREKARITKPVVKTLSTFAFPVFLTGLVGLSMGYMDMFAITLFRGTTEFGLYQAAQPLSNLLFSVAGSVLIVLFPMVSELWLKREKKLLGNMLRFLIKFSFILVIPVVLVFVAFPDIVIRIFFRPDYLPAAVALQILSVVTIFHLLTGILSQALMGIGKPMVVTKVTALMAVFNLVANLVFVPLYGIEGAAAATFGAYLLGSIMLFYYAKKFVRFSLPASSLFKTIVGGALTLIFIFGLKSILPFSQWPMLFVVGVLSLLFYAAWVLSTRAVSKDDLRLIARVVPIPRCLVKFASKFVNS